MTVLPNGFAHRFKQAIVPNQLSVTISNGAPGKAEVVQKLDRLLSSGKTEKE
jgi:hypothetical protein